MPLFFVTGLAGSGKSAVLAELTRRGHRAFGTDEDGYGRWIDARTGAVDPWPDPEPDFHAWYRQHDWVLDRERIEELAASSGPTYLCGMADGIQDLWHCFARVFALVADWDTLARRIAGRTGNHFGKDPAELAIVRHWHARFERTYTDLGPVLVDATRPVETVVDEILSRRCP